MIYGKRGYRLTPRASPLGGRHAREQADFRSLYDAWAHIATPRCRLMLTVLGGLAEFRRDLVRTRTSWDASSPKPKASSSIASRNSPITQKRELIRRRDIEGRPEREIARSYNVRYSTTQGLRNDV